jgi:uncharacterized membrane protein YfcA
MTTLQILSLLLLGMATGVIAGLLGIGGGMIMVPFLSFIFTQAHFSEEHLFHMAIATSMTTITFTSLSSVRAQLKKKMIHWHIVKVLVPGILFGGIVGGSEVFNLLKTPWLTLIFASFQIFSAYQMLLNKKPKPSRELPGFIGLFGVGTLIGLMSSLVGAGGAFISVPFMLWCNVPIHAALATSSALGFPIAIASAIGYIYGAHDLPGLPSYSLGYIYLPALICISITSVLFAPLGVKLAHSMNTMQLRKTFAFLLLVIASFMIYKSLQLFGFL